MTKVVSMAKVLTTTKIRGMMMAREMMIYKWKGILRTRRTRLL
jgi:hypothetical protein